MASSDKTKEEADSWDKSESPSVAFTLLTQLGLEGNARNQISFAASTNGLIVCYVDFLK